MADDTAPLFAVIDKVAPVLVPYTQDRIIDELWHRPGLAPRDRAIVTVSALVSRNATVAYPHYLNKALDSGLAPAELSELITHLAFYAGWPFVFGAVGVLAGIYAERGIGADQLPAINPDLLAMDAALPDEDARQVFIADAVAPVSPSLQHFTDDLLYHEVWRRPDLAPRDRCLATVVALAAQGQAGFLPFYLNRAVLQGVTREEFGEALAHVAFYAGWGNAIAAAGAAKAFYEGLN
ncbi:carboxymuconolactone decarboxylase family protein [Novosphingobium sp.]|uniref:carboxymuconolactone decarboxylase family protein n=1 Tax=Novosphingobium sp. TaxID=1874826 RepID=UPI0038BC4EA0